MFVLIVIWPDSSHSSWWSSDTTFSLPDPDDVIVGREADGGREDRGGDQGDEKEDDNSDSHSKLVFKHFELNMEKKIDDVYF